MHGASVAKTNLSEGIPAPFCGHPAFNSHPDDIDPITAADIFGFAAPGRPDLAAVQSLRASGVLGSGEGAMAAAVQAAMLAEGFVSDSIDQVVDAGISVLDPNSKMAAICKQAKQLASDRKNNFYTVRRILLSQWRSKSGCPLTKPGSREVGKDAKLNTALIIASLLTGGGAYYNTLSNAFRSGENAAIVVPATAAVLGVMLGQKNLPQTMHSGLDYSMLFSGTNFGFAQIPAALESYMRTLLSANNGSLIATPYNDEIIKPGKPEQFALNPLFKSTLPPASKAAPIKLKAKGNKLTLSRTGLKPSESVLWLFGDGGSAGGNKAVHSYAKPGLYQVSCRITDSLPMRASLVTNFLFKTASGRQKGTVFFQTRTRGTIDSLARESKRIKLRTETGTYITEKTARIEAENGGTEAVTPYFPNEESNGFYLKTGTNLLVTKAKDQQNNSVAGQVLKHPNPLKVVKTENLVVTDCDETKYPWATCDYKPLLHLLRGTYEGPEDISVLFKAAAGPEALYLLMKVTDNEAEAVGNKKPQPESYNDSLPNLGHTEAIDLFISQLPDAAAGKKQPVNKHLTLQLADLGLSMAGKKMELNTGKSSPAIKRTGTARKGIIEWSIPWKSIGFPNPVSGGYNGAAPDAFLFNLLVTDRDGSGQPKTLAWSITDAFIGAIPEGQCGTAHIR